MKNYFKALLIVLCAPLTGCSLETTTTTIKYLCRHYAVATATINEEDTAEEGIQLSNYISNSKNESYIKFDFEGNYEIKISYLRLDEEKNLIATVETGRYYVDVNNKIYMTTSEGEEKQGDDLYTKVYYLRIPTILDIEGEQQMYYVWFSGNPTDPNITCPIS
jgi:hypothetical protein